MLIYFSFTLAIKTKPCSKCKLAELSFTRLLLLIKLSCKRPKYYYRSNSMWLFLTYVIHRVLTSPPSVYCTYHKPNRQDYTMYITVNNCWRLSYFLWIRSTLICEDLSPFENGYFLKIFSRAVIDVVIFSEASS